MKAVALRVDAHAWSVRSRDLFPGLMASAVVASGVVRKRCSARAAAVARPSPGTLAHHSPVTGVSRTDSRT